MATTNKSLDQPASGSTNWDVPLNANFGYIDSALGGTTTKSVTGIGTTPVVLTAAEYRSLILNFTGTLTANVTYQVPSGVGGEWIVSNNTTGAYTLTIDNVASGASVVIPTGGRQLVYSDGTNVYAVQSSVAAVGASGNVAYSDGTGLVGSTAFTYSSDVLRAAFDSATANTAIATIAARRTTSGTAAIGLGSGYSFEVEAADASIKTAGNILTSMTDATVGSEDFEFRFQLMVNGAAAATIGTLSATQFLIGSDAVITARTSAGTAVQPIAYAGITATVDNDGTFSSGTYTPTPAGGNFKSIVNGGAFTLAAPTATGDYTLIIQITNNDFAGAITFSGFSYVTGSTVTTTINHDFFVYITKCNGFTSAVVQALQ